ncbi:hypothetical protein [Rhodohalobacter sp.]|uniref:hypothetical protein n=1 Tax=Rhodohalobacter sp. TaxID=1974210 RepID=UPI00356A1272
MNLINEQAESLQQVVFLPVYYFQNFEQAKKNRQNNSVMESLCLPGNDSRSRLIICSETTS